MKMPCCVVKLCKNYSTKSNKDTGITYHAFPADPVICDRWIAIVRLSRQESWWKPGKFSVICSAHFNESDLYVTKGGLKRLSNGAVPKNALFLSSMPPENISNNSALTAEPSTSIPVVGDDNRTVAAELLEPSTSVSVVEGTILDTERFKLNGVSENEASGCAVTISRDSGGEGQGTAQPTAHLTTAINCTGNETPEDDFSDIDCYFDTPEMMKLKKEINRKTVLQKKHARIIKTLREKIGRLRKANRGLKSIIKSLKQKRFIDNE